MPGAIELQPSVQSGWCQSDGGNSGKSSYEKCMRTIDVLASAFAAITLTPLLLLICVAIPMTSPGPVFYRQIRVGKGGAHFDMWKFRTMTTDADRKLTELKQANEMRSGVLFKIKNDPRVTTFGRFLRRFSLDELPQIANIIKGDMAIVGPRPALPEEVAKYDTRAKKRLVVKPGLTCFWQVSGRSELDFDQQIDLDLKYLNRRCLSTDLIIILKTVPAVLSARGAY